MSSSPTAPRAKRFLFNCMGRKDPLLVTADQYDRMTKDRRRWAAKLGYAHRKAKAADLKSSDKIAAIVEYLTLLSSEQVAPAMLNLIHDQVDEVFWHVLMQEWSRCDASWPVQARLGRLMAQHGRVDHLLYCIGDNFIFWDELPEKLTVYRGADRSRIEGGISWTTRIETAEFFAAGGRGYRFLDPVIATGVIAKKSVYFVCDDRSESEIVCLPKITKIERFDAFTSGPAT
jgi:hypothetical protein